MKGRTSHCDTELLAGQRRAARGYAGRLPAERPEDGATDDTSLPLLVVCLALRRGLCGEDAAMISKTAWGLRASWASNVLSPKPSLFPASRVEPTLYAKPHGPLSFRPQAPRSPPTSPTACESCRSSHTHSDTRRSAFSPCADKQWLLLLQHVRSTRTCIVLNIRCLGRVSFTR
jgi:hypothetical protein